MERLTDLKEIIMTVSEIPSFSLPFLRDQSRSQYSVSLTYDYYGEPFEGRTIRPPPTLRQTGRQGDRNHRVCRGTSVGLSLSVRRIPSPCVRLCAMVLCRRKL